MKIALYLIFLSMFFSKIVRAEGNSNSQTLTKHTTYICKANDGIGKDSFKIATVSRLVEGSNAPGHIAYGTSEITIIPDSKNENLKVKTDSPLKARDELHQRKLSLPNYNKKFFSLTEELVLEKNSSGIESLHLTAIFDEDNNVHISGDDYIVMNGKGIYLFCALFSQEDNQKPKVEPKKSKPAPTSTAPKIRA